MKTAAGFAYLYLIFLIALLSVAATATTAIYRYDRIRSEEAELLRIGAEFRQALHRFRDSRPERTYPASLDELLLDRRSYPYKRHLRKLYYDPITKKQDWGFVVRAGRIVGVHSISDKAPMKLAGFSAEDVGFEGSTRYSDWIFLAAPDAQHAKPVNNGLAN